GWSGTTRAVRDPAAHCRGGGGGGVRANGVRGFRAGEGRGRPLDLRRLSAGAGGARGVQALARGQWPLRRFDLIPFSEIALRYSNRIHTSSGSGFAFVSGRKGAATKPKK